MLGRVPVGSQEIQPELQNISHNQGIAEAAPLFVPLSPHLQNKGVIIHGEGFSWGGLPLYLVSSYFYITVYGLQGSFIHLSSI